MIRCRSRITQQAMTRALRAAKFAGIVIAWKGGHRSAANLAAASYNEAVARNKPYTFRLRDVTAAVKAVVAAKARAAAYG
jgi:hypothetical protein